MVICEFASSKVRTASITCKNLLPGTLGEWIHKPSGFDTLLGVTDKKRSTEVLLWRDKAVELKVEGGGSGPTGMRTAAGVRRVSQRSCRVISY